MTGLTEDDRAVIRASAHLPEPQPDDKAIYEYANGPVQTDTGPVELSVRAALATYSGLTGMQAPLAEMALRLARAYDGYEGADLTKLSRLNQELRQTLTVIAEVGLDDDDDRTGGLPAPVRHAADGPADVGPGSGGGGAPAG